MKLAILYIGVFIGGLVLFTSIFYFLDIGPKRAVVESTDMSLVDSDVPVEQDVSQADSNKESKLPDTIVESEFSACENLDCFMELAKSCTVGEIDNVDLPYTFDPRLTMLKSTYFRIDGESSDGECILIQEPRLITISISEESKKEVKTEKGW